MLQNVLFHSTCCCVLRDNLQEPLHILHIHCTRQQHQHLWHFSLTRTNGAGNQPTRSPTCPNHQSHDVIVSTVMMSPASKLSSSGSMVTWSHSASAKASGTSICHVTGREKEGLRLQETTYALLILNCRKVKLISTAVWERAFCFPFLI